MTFVESALSLTLGDQNYKMASAMACDGDVAFDSQEEGAGVLWDLEMKTTGSEGRDETGRFNESALEEGKMQMEVDRRSEGLKVMNLSNDLKTKSGEVETASEHLAKSGEKRCATVEEEDEGPMTPKRLFGQKKSGLRGRSRTKAITDLEHRIAVVEVKQATIERLVNDLADTMRNFEERSRSGVYDGERIRFISKEEMVKYVELAIGSCNSAIGCSKSYIRKFLLDKFEVPTTPHYMKKTNAAIQVALAEKRISFDAKHGLFKL